MERALDFKLTLGGRVQVFGAEHPDPNPKAIEEYKRLDTLLLRGGELATQYALGMTSVRSGTIARKALRKAILDTPLRHLVRIATAASVEEPALTERFTMGKVRGSFQVFLASARSMAKDAASHRELFLSYGMPQNFLDDLNAALDQFEQAISTSASGLSARTGARADLKAVTSEIMTVVGKLDAINRLRFQNQPELLQAWESVRNIPWRNGTPPSTPAGPGSDGSRTAA